MQMSSRNTWVIAITVNGGAGNSELFDNDNAFPCPIFSHKFRAPQNYFPIEPRWNLSELKCYANILYK